MSTCEDRCSKNTAETVHGPASAGPGCTAANTSDRCVFACCDKIFFFFGDNKVVFSTQWHSKTTRGVGDVDTLVDVVKPVDDVEEGEGEGEYYP